MIPILNKHYHVIVIIKIIIIIVLQCLLRTGSFRRYLWGGVNYVIQGEYPPA